VQGVVSNRTEKASQCTEGNRLLKASQKRENIMEAIKYAIKSKAVTEPEIELPEGSQVVEIKSIIIDGAKSWWVVWLEPI